MKCIILTTLNLKNTLITLLLKKKDSIKNQSTLILLQFDEYHLLLDCYILAEHTQIGIIWSFSPHREVCEKIWPTYLRPEMNSSAHSERHAALTLHSCFHCSQREVCLYVYLAQRCAWLQPSEWQTEKCSLLYVRLPASSSIVNTACVVYGNVGHLFVVLLGVRPQVKVDDNRVHTAGLSISLLHQLVETVFDQLHAPNGTTSDLYFSPVSWRQKLTWKQLYLVIWNIIFSKRNKCIDTLLSHRSSTPASVYQSIVELLSRQAPEEPCSQQTWWASPC